MKTFKVNKKVKDDPDPKKVVYELEQTDVTICGETIEKLERDEARFLAMVDEIRVKKVLLEAQ